MQQMSRWKSAFVIAASALILISPSSFVIAQTAAPIAGNDAKSYVQFGTASGAKGDFEAAISAFNEAIKIDPKYAPAYYFRGYAHAQEKKMAEALTDYDKAIDIEPKYRDAIYQRGCLKGQQGDFDGAVGDFNKVIELDPKNVAAYYNRGHVYYFKGDLDKAVVEVNQALSLNANFTLGYFIRGLIRHAQGHRDEAMADFQKSAGLSFPYGAYWIWICHMESGQRGIAHKEMEEALAKPQLFRPGDWTTSIAEFLLEKISQDELLKRAAVGDAADIPAHMCEAWYYSGIVKYLAGDKKAAQDCFTKAISSGSRGSEEFIEAQRELAEMKAP